MFFFVCVSLGAKLHGLFNLIGKEETTQRTVRTQGQMFHSALARVKADKLFLVVRLPSRGRCSCG
jgi:hypothetical protein